MSFSGFTHAHAKCSPLPRHLKKALQHVNRPYLRVRMQNVEEKKRLRSGWFSVDSSIIIRLSQRLISQRWTTWLFLSRNRAWLVKALDPRVYCIPSHSTKFCSTRLFFSLVIDREVLQQKREVVEAVPSFWKAHWREEGATIFRWCWRTTLACPDASAITEGK